MCHLLAALPTLIVHRQYWPLAHWPVVGMVQVLMPEGEVEVCHHSPAPCRFLSLQAVPLVLREQVQVREEVAEAEAQRAQNRQCRLTKILHNAHLA